jgi:hypothetical protein
MSMQLNQVVPWGRSLHEYQLMFDLQEQHLQGKILCCADGPASFNAELTAQSGSVVSCDPIYEFTGEQIAERFEASVETILSQVRARPENYVWQYHKNPEHLGLNRRAAMQRFLQDYPLGRQQSRYRVASLPVLPFQNGAFNLALCSHFLFLYSELLSEEFHWQSILELCRVAKEVRIFPLVGLDCLPSPHLPALLQNLARAGFQAEIHKAPYQLQKNGDQFMRIVELERRPPSHG